MECILIALPKKEQADKIAGLIRRKGIDADIRICSSPSAVLSEAADKTSGILLCTEHVKDMNYSELFDYVPPGFEMILLSKNLTLNVDHPRITLLSMPFMASELLRLVTDTMSRRQHIQKKKKPVRTGRTPEEQQVIDRAKELLMNKQNLTEPEAFRMLQKQSMDYGRTLVESAQMILLLNSQWE